MAININYVKVLVYDLAAKQQNAFPSPQDFTNYCNLAQSDLFNYYNDEREKQLLKVKAGQTIFMPSTLSTFIVNQQALTGASGFILAPSGYIYDQTMSTSGDIIMTKTDNERLSAYLNSTIDLPTTTAPIYVELNNSFQVYPKSISAVKLSYIRKPNDVLWAYTLVNNRPVYNPSASIDFEWQSTEVLRLVSRILKLMGISIRDSELESAAQQMTIQAS